MDEHAEGVTLATALAHEFVAIHQRMIRFLPEAIGSRKEIKIRGLGLICDPGNCGDLHLSVELKKSAKLPSIDVEGSGFSSRIQQLRGSDIEHEVLIDSNYDGSAGDLDLSIFDLVRCPTCYGPGISEDRICITCDGSGLTKANRTIQVPMLKSLRPGQRIRFEELGRPGKHGGPPGDLIVLVSVGTTVGEAPEDTEPKTASEGNGSTKGERAGSRIFGRGSWRSTLESISGATDLLAGVINCAKRCMTKSINFARAAVVGTALTPVSFGPEIMIKSRCQPIP